ncbi:hypothetical protein AL755_13330 [Arthrobacter sp. ERGS1:01]|uniref:DUF1206 domain-containing protein n=1 Tax=Arthrobacter sp. ERGS1:01 TaxID=1704044 RepID=UPI0006B5EEF2|nr:DUF1206 domain-containing protein [Arthrobacter sp. ERGS1:01]ALE06220.1 hypothetical protein AL755_13330 [Arthrobacter sp. ERGS1:01]
MKGDLEDATETAERVKRSTLFTVAARSGFAVSGLLHILIGYLAIRIALGATGAQADLSGAVGGIAAQTGGQVMLWVAGAACSVLCLWHLANALLDHGPLKGRGRQRRKGGAGRALSSLAQGIAFALVAGTFVAFALGHGSNSSKSTSDWTAELMKLPWGPKIVIGLGGIVAIVGVVFVIRGLIRSFRKELSLPPAGPVRKFVTVLGMVGYVAKGIVLLLVGLLLVMSSLQAKPRESTGVDGALKALRAQPYGVYVLSFVGAGLICYGLYLMVKARYLDMRG